MKKDKFGGKIVVLFLCILLGCALFKAINPGVHVNVEENEQVEEKKPNDKKDEKNTYLGKVVNNSGSTVDDSYQDIIVKYMDLYTKSLVDLKTEDVTKLFTNPDGIDAYVAYSAIDYMVEHHKLQANDMRLTSASYDIEYKSVKSDVNKVTIEFLEDAYYKFKFIDDVTSRTIDVKHTFVIDKEKKTIDSLNVVQDNYVMFTNEVDATSTKADVDKLKDGYLTRAKKEATEIEKLKEVANSKEYKSNKTCAYAYDREAAVKYADMYADDRNSEYYDFSSLGGNCANYGSQTIRAGGIPNDYTGVQQWKYYSEKLNNSNTASGRSASFVSTSAFYTYAKNNSGKGMCADTDVNIYYALGGDIIHVGYNGYTHTVVVKDQIKKDGKVVDILVNSNTVGLKDYPLSGYAYPNKRLIKILGYND